MVKTSDQKKLHEPIKKWLESNGIKVLPESEKMPVSIKDYVPNTELHFSGHYWSQGNQ